MGTLAALASPPPRTAVVSFTTKASENGHSPLSTSRLVQMARHTEFRGTDKSRHIGLVRNPHKGIPTVGFEPTFYGAGGAPVSQFTMSYGLALNLLLEAKTTLSSEADELKSKNVDCVFEEVRKLMQRRSGNHFDKTVMRSLKEEHEKIESEVALLALEVTDSGIDMQLRSLTSEEAYIELCEFQKVLRAEKKIQSELQQRMEAEKMDWFECFLEENGENLPFISLQYKGARGIKHNVSAMYLGKVDTDLSVNESTKGFNSEEQKNTKIQCYAALGSDNSWYLFSKNWIENIFKKCGVNSSKENDHSSRKNLWNILSKSKEGVWDKISDSELGSLWTINGSRLTWHWSLNIPISCPLSENYEVIKMSQGYTDAMECCENHKDRISELKKKIEGTDGFLVYKKIVDLKNFNDGKIKHLKAKLSHLVCQMEEIDPPVWNNFLEICSVLHETGALDMDTVDIFPLGETASTIRGENELWLAMAFQSKVLLGLMPPQLAAVFSCFVSDGIEIQPSNTYCYLFSPSPAVLNCLNFLGRLKSYLLEMQQNNGVKVPCRLDDQFCGMVEAWASGLQWEEIKKDCALDEGGLTSLMRRTADLLSQIWNLPNVDPLVGRNAREAFRLIDQLFCKSPFIFACIIILWPHNLNSM